ncbi:MAG: NAD(P)H-hydrate dehydratase [Flavobacteriaceae bacterium]
MKILSSSELKLVDEQTIVTEGIESVDLMERASMALYEQLKEDFDIKNNLFCIVCGSGNNGGDGLALARIITQNGGQAKVYLHKSQKYSTDNLINQNRLDELNIPIHFFELDQNPDFPGESVVIDALFGYGLSRPLNTEWKNSIAQINQQSTVVSVDLPSGLMADSFTEKNHPIVKATKTYTFQTPKLALLLPENALYSGETEVLDIGLDKKAIKQIQTSCFYTTLSDIQEKIIYPNRFSHKGTFGHSLIIGGSYGKMGAVVLSSKSALRTGCGLITTYVPKCGYQILQTAFPEAMTLTDKDSEYLINFPKDITSFSAIGIGIGMGTHPETQEGFIDFLKNCSLHKPKLVLDADALNILSQNKQALHFLPENTIITPHPKELERLIGSWENDFEKLEKAMNFSKEFKLILAIKGANTCVVLPNGELHFNATGNWGMATAGSGDVLTGIITSLLAQGYAPENATILGVFLHGLSADLQVKSIHKKSLIASDIINGIFQAWKIIC